MSEIFGVMRAPREIVFGHGQRHALGGIAARLGSRLLICTDQRFAGSEAMNGIEKDLRSRSLEVKVFDGTLAELPSSSIEACVARSRGFRPDVIVGLGGGSCMDMAKLVSLLLTHDGPLDQYYGEFKVPGPIIPVIAIPTTAGTGSEVTPVAVLAEQNRDLKVGISSPYLIPHAAICDAELTMSCPPALTALSGADALTHAVEAFTAVTRTPDAHLSQKRVFVGKNLFSDGHAIAAIRAIYQYLPIAIENGQDAVARNMLMFGSLSAGLAFGTAGTAAAHAIQYPVGALTHTPHGLGVATLLPYVMKFNATHTHRELVEIGRAIGIRGGCSDNIAELAIDAIRQLCAGIGIPRTLGNLGVTEDKLHWIAEQSMLSARLIDNNPKPLSLLGVHELVESAFHGSSNVL